MANFAIAVNYLLEDEGGYSPYNPATGDPETNFGITDSVARDHGYTGPMRDMPLDTAKGIYYQSYWRGLDAIKDQKVATGIFTYRVNMGVSTGDTLLQRALNAMGAGIAVDGIMGPITIQAANMADPNILLDAVVSAAIAHYKDIVEAHPEKSVYLKGWINRAERLLRMPTFEVIGGVVLAILAVMLLVKKW
jgi:lysozyme family protein